jgi:hypothetical protein
VGISGACATLTSPFLIELDGGAGERDDIGGVDQLLGLGIGKPCFLQRGVRDQAADGSSQLLAHLDFVAGIADGERSPPREPEGMRR